MRSMPIPWAIDEASPNIVLGLGAVFSALEVVPLVLIWFVRGLVTGHSFDRQGYLAEGGWEVLQKEVATLGR